MQSFQQHASKSEFGSIRAEKLRAGEQFLRSLATLPLRFAGIAGSVSYDPLPGDDIDIFIITKSRRLWTTILLTLLKRRLHGSTDICPCLFMSEDYALEFFTAQHDILISEDSIRAVPVIGESYYRGLLAKSPFIVSLHPDYGYGSFEPLLKKAFVSPLEAVCFLIGACFLKLKGLVVNRSLRRKGRDQETFRTIVSPGCMILDTLKYSNLRSETAGDVE